MTRFRESPIRLSFMRGCRALECAHRMIKRSELGKVPLMTSALDELAEPELSALSRFGDDPEDSGIESSSSAQLLRLEVLSLRFRAGANRGGIVLTSQRSSSVEAVDIPDEKSETPDREVREGEGANSWNLMLF